MSLIESSQEKVAWITCHCLSWGTSAHTPT